MSGQRKGQNMNEKNKTPTQGQGLKTVQSTPASIDANKTNISSVICVVERPKAVLLSSTKTDEQLWFKKSDVKVVTGEYGAGALLEVQIAPSVIKQARANKRFSPIQFKDSILVTGYCTRTTDKAIGVLCDADEVERFFAKNNITEVRTSVENDQAICLVVPAWMLKCAGDSGEFPSWVEGARL